jgi:CSLREA domain-containing protein
MFRYKRLWKLVLALVLVVLVGYGIAPERAQAVTITVNTLADTTNVPGQCSLRDAIQHANTDSKFYANSSCPAGSGHDTITFSVSGTIKLGSALNANTPITIQGPIILSGDEVTRLFNVGNNGNLTLVNLTVRDGRSATAGAIDANNGTLNLAGVSFVNNAATGNDGGAIRAGRSLSILGSSFSGNQAEQRGGAILFTGGASHTLLISATNFSGNQAGQRGGAIAAPSTSNILIYDSVFSGNIAEGSQNTHGGGAIYIDNGYDDNEVVIERAAFSGNLTLFGSGGAIFLNDDVPVYIRDSSFNGNASGGPAYSGQGGAIFSQNGKLDARRATFNGNLTSNEGTGGAIHQVGTGATTAVTNSSFFANAAPNGQGGALRVAAGQMHLRNVTLASNTAGAGSALNNSGTVQVWNSILSGGDPVCAGTAPQNQGANLQHPGASCGGSIPSADPRLESPAFNGGALASLLTLALRPDSPAIDAGNAAVCAAAPVNNEDQRGQPRPRDGDGDGNAVCDIGAYETVARFAGYGSTPIQPGPIFIGSTTAGALTSGTFTIFETGNADLILSQPIIGGEHAASFSLATSFPLTIPDGGPAAQVEIVCSSNTAGTRTATLSLLTNDPNRPEVIYNLLCEVTAAPAPAFGSSPIVPGPLNFGPVYLGETGAATIALSNSGTADLILGPVSLSGSHAADFAIDFIPSTIPFGHAPIEGTIHCTPTTVGLRTAQLNIPTNDPTQPQVSFNLACQGEPPPLQPLSAPGQSLIHNPAEQIYLDGASYVALSPDGRHVYVTAYNSARVAIFGRNSQTGFLTVQAPLSSVTLAGVHGIAMSPDGQQVYVTSVGGGGQPANFQVLLRNDSSGSLAGGFAIFRNGIELTNFHSPTGIAVSPDGQHIYVAATNSNAIFIVRRHASGAVSYVATATSNTNLAGVLQLAVSADGTHLYAVSHTSNTNGRIAVYQRNPQTGLLSFKQVLSHNTLQAWPGCPVVTVLGMGGAAGLALSPAGDHLYVASSGSNALARFRRNADGSLCYLGRTQAGLGGVVGLEGAWDVTVTPDGKYVYATAVIADAVTAFERNPLNGALTQRQLIVPNLAGLPALDGALGLALSPDGRSLHVAALVDDAIVTLPAANPQPSLDSLLPASATAGSQSLTLAVRGNAFAPDAVIQVNSQNRSTQYISANELRTTLTAADLAAAGSLAVRVANPAPGGGISVNTLNFTVTAPGQNPVPSIDYLNPQGKAAGEPAFTLVIKGTNFINGSQVRWNGSNRTTTFVNSGEVRAAITAVDLLSPGPAAVTVVNPGPGGGTSNVIAFQVATPGQNPVPSITGLAPTSTIARGAQSQPLVLVIQGQGFLPESQARWNGENRATTYVSPTQLRVTLSAADVAFGGYGAVTVSNPIPGGGVSNPVTLSVFGHTLYLPAVLR